MFDAYEILGPGPAAITSSILRARHRHTGRACALKRTALTEVDERRIMRNRLASRLKLVHPNIVPLLDAALTEEDLWTAFPWFDRGCLTLDSVSDWVGLRAGLIDLCAALAHAHAAGLVHRDVKPENVLVDDDGRWVLADFGILRGMHELDDVSRPQGTPSYVAPEQIRGEKSLTRPWTDLYALGAVAWALATGAPPFVGKLTTVIRAHLTQEPGSFEPRFPVPDGFEALLRRLLAKAPWERPTYAATVIQQLRALDGPTPEGAESRPELIPLTAQPTLLGVWRLPDEIPAPLRAAIPIPHPRPVARLWDWLVEVDQSGRPMVLDVPNDLDTVKAIHHAGRVVSETGVALTFFPHKVPSARMLRHLLTTDPVTLVPMARTFGCDWPLEDLQRALDGDPTAIAGLLCASGENGPVVASIEEVEVVDALRRCTSGRVLALFRTDEAPPSPLTPTLEEQVAFYARHIGVDSETARARVAPDGLRAALNALKPRWLAAS